MSTLLMLFKFSATLFIYNLLRFFFQNTGVYLPSLGIVHIAIFFMTFYVVQEFEEIICKKIEDKDDENETQTK